MREHKFKIFERSNGEEFEYCVDCLCLKHRWREFLTCEEFENYIITKEVLES
jgi:hypothetical protein